MKELAVPAPTATGKHRSGRKRSLARREEMIGYLLISPWLIGFLLFELMPVIASFALSMTRYAVVDTPVWIGLDNYRTAFFEDRLFWRSVWNTVYYVGFGVPLRIAGAFLLALLLNAKIRGILSFRVIYYLPSIVPIVGTAVLWFLLLNPRTGLINLAFNWVGLPSINWLGDPAWSKPAFILMSLWTLGGSMVIFLAGLQGIPDHLYEAAEIDGANAVRRFWSVTVPLMTPTLFLTLVMNIISSFQVFSAAYIVTGGGPRQSTLFYMLHLYQNAFGFFKMGYASALAWLLFMMIVVITLLVVRGSDRWVFYQGGR
jgi:multiple sugar transport system permease protein